jgi:2-methylcitrate dehydratase
VDGPTQALVDFARATRELSTGAVAGATRQFLDGVGCAAGGLTGAAPVIARTLARTARGGVSAYGLGDRSTPEYATFANACATRQLDYNDCYTGGVVGGGHPSDMTPAIVGAVEASGGSGRDVIRGIHVAYEVYAVIADRIPLRDLGFDQGVNLAISVAVALAHVWRLSEAETANAVSLAITPNLPMRVTRAGELSHWKGCAAAEATMAAVWATRLAAAGMTGPPRPFEGVDALARHVDRFDFSGLGDPVGGRAATERCLIKRFPSEMSSQAPIAKMLALRPRIPVDELASLDVTTYHLAWHEIGGGQGDRAEKWDPQTRETADHSLPYLLAVALVDGDVTQDSFSAERVADQALRPIMERITVHSDPQLEDRFRTPRNEMVARFRIRMTDGTELSDEIGFPPGHPEQPMSDDELSDKFLGMAQRVLPEDSAARMLDLLWHLDELTDLAEVTALFRAWSPEDGSPSSAA